MTEGTTVGVDRAKTSVTVHGAHATEKTLLR
jgi:hypothetical protein